MSTTITHITPSNVHGHLVDTGNNIGATLLFPQDRIPYVVIAATKSGKSLTAVRLATVDLTTGHKPARYDGPFPVWSHFYTDEERRTMRLEGNEVTLRWSEKKQRYTNGGTPFSVGTAQYHRNHSY